MENIMENIVEKIMEEIMECLIKLVVIIVTSLFAIVTAIVLFFAAGIYQIYLAVCELMNDEQIEESILDDIFAWKE